MKLYHGSYIPVEIPDLTHSRKNVDFGVGFYVTPLYEQAVNWCHRFKKRNKDSIVSVYDFSDTALKDLNVLQFDSYNEKWLDFVLECRNENDQTQFDIVIGRIANDRVYNTVELYLEGLIDKPNLQIALRTEKALSHLHYKEYIRL